MARIRSIHPGLWTDEAFVSVSQTARLLAIGIWNECDDQGAFEWKPLGLKMKLLPADNVDVASLLGELLNADIIAQYEVDGRKYGAVRNFGRWQRPKKPNSVYPMPSEWRKYAATDRPTSEPDEDEGGQGSGKGSSQEEKVPHQFPTSSPPVPTKSEKSSQMEDGGGRREEEKEKEEESLPSEARASDELAMAVDGWNAMAERTGLPAVQRLTDSRRRSLRLRLSDCGGIEGWQAALGLVEASSFLRGDSGKWSADFDFLLQAKSFTKLMEGGYSDRRKAEPEGILARRAREARMRPDDAEFGDAGRFMQ